MPIRLNTYLIGFAAIISLFTVSMPAIAAGPQLFPEGWSSGDCNIITGEFKAKCIPEFVGHIIQTIVSLIGGLFLINVMIAGYEIAYGAYSGNNAAGKDRLLWSVIGFIVSVCSYLILDFVIRILIL